MKTTVTLEEVLFAFKRYCKRNNMDGVDLWYWLNTHHISLEVRPTLTEEDFDE